MTEDAGMRAKPGVDEDPAAALARDVRCLNMRLSEEGPVVARGERAAELESRVRAAEAASAESALESQRHAVALATANARASEGLRQVLLARERARVAEVRSERALFALGTMRELLARERGVVTGVLGELDQLVFTHRTEKERLCEALDRAERHAGCASETPGNDLVTKPEPESSERDPARVERDAREAAEKLVSEAKNEASGMIELAKTEASDIGIAATKEARSLVESAKTEASDIMKEAKKEALRIAKEAKEERVQLLREARAEAKSALEKQAERDDKRAERVISRAESRLASAEQRIEALLAELKSAHNKTRTDEDVVVKPARGTRRSPRSKGLGKTFSPAPLAYDTILGRPADRAPESETASESRSRYTDTLPYEQDAPKIASPTVAAPVFSKAEVSDARPARTRGRRRGQELSETPPSAGDDAADVAPKRRARVDRPARSKGSEARQARASAPSDSDWVSPSEQEDSDSDYTREPEADDGQGAQRPRRGRGLVSELDVATRQTRARGGPARTGDRAKPETVAGKKTRSQLGKAADRVAQIHDYPRRGRPRTIIVSDESDASVAPDGEEVVDRRTRMANGSPADADARPLKKRTRMISAERMGPIGASPSRRTRAQGKGTAGGKPSQAEPAAGVQAGARRGMRKRKRVSYDYSVSKGLDVSFEFARPGR